MISTICIYIYILLYYDIEIDTADARGAADHDIDDAHGPLLDDSCHCSALFDTYGDRSR